jgi:hypothetical protein
LIILHNSYVFRAITMSSPRPGHWVVGHPFGQKVRSAPLWPKGFRLKFFCKKLSDEALPLGYARAGDSQLCDADPTFWGTKMRVLPAADRPLIATSLFLCRALPCLQGGRKQAPATRPTKEPWRRPKEIGFLDGLECYYSRRF